MISRIKAELLSDEDAKKLDADATYGVRLTNRNGDERFVSVCFTKKPGLQDPDYLSSVTWDKIVHVKMFDGDKKIHEFKRSDFAETSTFSGLLRYSVRSIDNKNVQKLYDKAFGVIYKAEAQKAKLEAKRKEMEEKKAAKEKANSPFNLGCLNFLKGRKSASK